MECATVRRETALCRPECLDQQDRADAYQAAVHVGEKRISSQAMIDESTQKYRGERNRQR